MLITLGEYHEAETVLQTGYKMVKEGDRPNEIVYYLLCFGELKTGQRQFKEAQQYYQDVYEKINDQYPENWLIRLFTLWGQSRIEAGDISAARTFFTQAIAAENIDPARIHVTMSTFGLAKIELEENGRTAAKNQLQDAINLIKEFPEVPLLEKMRQWGAEQGLID